MLVLLKAYSLFEVRQKLLLTKIPNNKNSQNNADKEKTDDKNFLLHLIEIGCLVLKLLI